MKKKLHKYNKKKDFTERISHFIQQKKNRYNKKKKKTSSMRRYPRN